MATESTRTALPGSGPLAGYLGAPYVSIEGGGGTGATAVALFDHVSGTVTGLLLTSPGTDYATPPTVTLMGGGPTSVVLGAATVGAHASGGLTKLGSGTLVLGGTNTYAGPTLVSAGTLALNGVHSGGAVTVQAAAVLSGTGLVGAAVAVAGDATVRPGHLAAAGRLTVASVAFGDQAQFSPLVNGTASVLRVTGLDGLTVPAGTNVLRVNHLNTALPPGTYTIIDYDGALQGGAVSNLALYSYPPRSVMYLTNNAANTSIDLVVVALADSIKWLGLNGTNWNINLSTNWITVGGAVTTARGAPLPWTATGAGTRRRWRSCGGRWRARRPGCTKQRGSEIGRWRR